nr:hypothetical protein [Tanacetum cinerariifolium]
PHHGGGSGWKSCCRGCCGGVSSVAAMVAVGWCWQLAVGGVAGIKPHHGGGSGWKSCCRGCCGGVSGVAAMVAVGCWQLAVGGVAGIKVAAVGKWPAAAGCCDGGGWCSGGAGCRRAAAVVLEAVTERQLIHVVGRIDRKMGSNFGVRRKNLARNNFAGKISGNGGGRRRRAAGG